MPPITTAAIAGSARSPSPYRSEGVVVEDDVWIGYGAIVLSGVHIGRGAIVASASIDGTGTPAVTKGFGIASITDNGTGDYTLTLTRSAQTASDFTVFASTNQGAGNVRCDLNGVNSVRIRCFAADGTTATDVNELKVLVMRVA